MECTKHIVFCLILLTSGIPRKSVDDISVIFREEGSAPLEMVFSFLEFRIVALSIIYLLLGVLNYSFRRENLRLAITTELRLIIV
jgi:hypothetical protein